MKRIRIGTRKVRAPAGARNSKTASILIFNNPRSSIKSESPPDLSLLYTYMTIRVQRKTRKATSI